MIVSCDNFLEEKVYTEYDPSELLKDESGLDALLTGAYARSRVIGYVHRNYTYMFNEFCTDIAFETGGGLERNAAPFINFTWDPSNESLNSFWTQMYASISSANSVLNVVSNASGISEEIAEKAVAEARFIRATAYYYLYNLFGPVPIIELPNGASPDEIQEIGSSTPRASREEMVEYLVDDLTYASSILPVEENPIGRATKGAALGLLTKVYMHEKNWEKAAETAQAVIDLGYYSLYDDYQKMFTIEGEDNKEYIYRAPCIPQSGYHNNYMPHAFPPNYPIQDNWVNFGAQFRTYTAFYDTFEAGDARLKCFVTEYDNQAGEHVLLLRDENGEALDNVRSFKYWPDPDAVGECNGNDIVYIRYADILLCKAEAINEISGPTQEAIDLINMVRRRANVSELTLADYTQSTLRDFILAERGREFFTEGLRREDLIRNGSFISNAQARGKDAHDYQTVYPIPLRQIEANSNLQQNDGYSN